MTTRRSFIQTAACTVLPVAGAGQAAASPIASLPTTSRDRQLHAVVIDEDHAEARRFGRRLGARGVAALSIREGDITSSWLAAIRPEWTRRPSSIAGLTTPAALFCLEHLAWQHGLRVVFHAEHIVLPDGNVEHQVQRDPRMSRLTAANLQRAGAGWPVRLADAMAAHHATERRPGPSLAALQPALPEGATLLTSWIIAAV